MSTIRNRVSLGSMAGAVLLAALLALAACQSPAAAPAPAAAPPPKPAPTAAPVAAPTTAPAVAPTAAKPAPTVAAAAPAKAASDEPPAALVEKAKQEGKVSWYTSAKTEDGDPLVKAFESKYGVKVERYRAGAMAVLQKFFSEREKGMVVPDVIDAPYTPAFIDMKARGWLEPALKELPIWDFYSGKGRDKDGTWVSQRGNMYGILWNTQRVSAGDEPKSWKEAISPKWKGQVGVADPLEAGGAAGWTVYMLQSPDFGMDFLRKLRENGVRMYAQGGQVRDGVVSGQLALSAGVGYDNYPLAKEAGAPVGWAFPVESVPTSLTPMAVLKGAPRPNAGRLFVNFMLSRQGQALGLENRWYSVREGMEKPDWLPPADRVFLPDWDKLSPDEVRQMLEKSSDTLRGK